MAYYRGITNVVHLQLHKNNYFNIAKARREREAEERERASAWMDGDVRGSDVGRDERGGGRREEPDQESTSEREYEVDA